MVSPKAYIRNVNTAVNRGSFNRKIKVVYTKNKPTTEGRLGVASHINMQDYDRIAIWKGLARNSEERKARERMLSEKLGRKVRVITREEALRHELWHIHRPYASERLVRSRLEKKSLPNELPTKRRY